MACTLHPVEIICGLAQHVKAAVVPHMGTWRARRVTGIAASGDATFDIDEIAEQAVSQYLVDNEVNVAYYSEDRGLVNPLGGTEPQGILIIDPIDGTRGAIAGFEACVVSVAWAAYKPQPVLSDVKYAALVEIKGTRMFLAERGAGTQIREADGTTVPAALSPQTDIPGMAWATEVVGAPVDLVFKAMGGFASKTTVRGGLFILNSSAFELTRLVSGQLAAVVDIRNRLLRSHPELTAIFTEYGGGRLLSLYGYDIAAAALVVEEAGGVVTDAWGQSLANWNLLDTTEANFGSLVACANPELHSKLMAEIDASFATLII
jgi:myo-inositol-1(or 4)-monophosphatase